VFYCFRVSCSSSARCVLCRSLCFYARLSHINKDYLLTYTGPRYATTSVIVIMSQGLTVWNSGACNDDRSTDPSTVGGTLKRAPALGLTNTTIEGVVGADDISLQADPRLYQGVYSRLALL